MEKGNSNILALSVGRIPMLLTFDDGYAAQAGVMIKSLLDNKYKNVFYDLYIITDELNYDNRNKLKEIVNEYENNTLTILDGNKYSDITEKYGKLNDNEFFTNSSLYRLIPMLIPEFDKYDKIIYSDVDIVVKKDISELYDFNVENAYTAGVRHLKHSEHFIRHIEEPLRKKYIYAGLLVMNLKKMREEEYKVRIIDALTNEKYTIKWFDMDILNIACNGDVEYLDIKYICMPEAYEVLSKKKEGEEYYTKEEIDNAFLNPSIIHYVGRKKPWKSKYVEYCQEWFFWVKKTPFKEQYENMEIIINDYIENYKYKYKIYLFKIIPLGIIDLKNTGKKIKVKILKKITILKFNRKKYKKMENIEDYD